MFNTNRLYDFRRTQSQVANDYLKEAQRAITNYQQAMNRISMEARNKARAAYQRYYEELQAAAQGDDAMERSGAAWLGYQQNYAQIYQEYVTACQEQYQTAAEAMQNLQQTINMEALKNYIDLLEETRTEMNARLKKPGGTPKKGEAGSAKTA